jgi:alkaline phosphatase
LTTGGRIDHAHHDTKAHLALDETVEFAKAVQTAADLTDEEDTLIVVTADHAHTMSLSGYPARGNDILREYEGNTEYTPQWAQRLGYGLDDEDVSIN